MINTTVCYIEKDNKYLMLHRIKKKNDINKDKWIGVGGKFQNGESPEDCVLREVKEETGLTLQKYKLRGIITFVFEGMDFEGDNTEHMYIFTSNEFKGQIIDCKEGILEWIDKKQIFNLNIWEGDKIFLKILQEKNCFFTGKFEYKKNKLIKYKINEY